MGILRTYAIVFLAGWILWLWVDKDNAPVNPQTRGAPWGATMPGYPAYPSYPAGRGVGPPPSGGDMIDEFQYGVNLIKAGEYKGSFVYLWRKQSWVYAGLLTALLSLLLPPLGRILKRGRTRMRKRDPEHPAE